MQECQWYDTEGPSGSKVLTDARFLEDHTSIFSLSFHLLHLSVFFLSQTSFMDDPNDSFVWNSPPPTLAYFLY